MLRFAAGLFVLALGAPAAFEQAAPVPAPPVPGALARIPSDIALFPLEDVKPGMHGIGRTVFANQKMETFDVEIIGALENSAPKQTMVMARLTGGPLANTGVIAGMSGSPVYIDGKLLGAVAFGFAFSKEAIAGITPYVEMTGFSRLDDIIGSEVRNAVARHDLIELVRTVKDRQPNADATMARACRTRG